jgi:hypothetical protein
MNNSETSEAVQTAGHPKSASLSIIARAGKGFCECYHFYPDLIRRQGVCDLGRQYYELMV